MNRNEAIVPSLHHRKEGWPSDEENCAKHPLTARPGWFSDENNKENHPGCVCFGGFAIFFDNTATPPCGDARRGLSPHSDLFTASMTAPTEEMHASDDVQKPRRVSQAPVSSRWSH